MDYYYRCIGTATPSTFAAIHQAFPAIVGIDARENDDGEIMIIMGVSIELSDKALNMYQLIVELWYNDDAMNFVCSQIM